MSESSKFIKQFLLKLKRDKLQLKLKKSFQKKQLKKQVKTTEESVDVSQRLRKVTGQVGKVGKKVSKHRTSITNGHSHTYTENSKYTSVSKGHKHLISKKSNIALAGSTGHRHLL